MGKTLVNCTCCEGKGKRVATEVMGKSHKMALGMGVFTVLDFSKKAGIELTAAHHRIARLVKLGAVKKVGDGVPVRYVALR